MDILKRVAPYLVVVVIVTVLYNLQHEETLSVGESRYIEQFSQDVSAEERVEGSPSTDESTDGDQLQADIADILQQHEPGDVIDLAVFTSNSEDENVQWTDYFHDELQNQYEFQVHTFAMDDFNSSNSEEFVALEEWTIINEQDPDLIIYEPLAHRDGDLEESKVMTSEIINGFDGYPVLKIPSYENEDYVQEWAEFAQDADLRYVSPDEQAISDSALTQADGTDNES